MRLIDADKLTEYVYEIDDPLGIIKAVPLQFIEDADTVDAVEVVRCRECMYSASIVDEITRERDGLWCALLDLENVEEDFYCKDGQRREDGDT